MRVPRHSRAVRADAVNVLELDARFHGAPYARVRSSLAEIGIPSTLALFSGYFGQRAGLAPWLLGTRINRDRNLCLQYIAGFDHTADDRVRIYQEINPQRKVPVGFFIADDSWKASLREAIASARLPTVHPG